MDDQLDWQSAIRSQLSDAAGVDEEIEPSLARIVIDQGSRRLAARATVQVAAVGALIALAMLLVAYRWAQAEGDETAKALLQQEVPVEPLKRSRWLTAVSVTLVFAIGVATGAFASRALQQRRLREVMTGDPAATRTTLTLFALERRVGLNATQSDEAARILRAQEDRYRDAVEPCRPQVRALRVEMLRQLTPILQPGQKAAIEELDRPRTHDP